MHGVLQVLFTYFTSSMEWYSVPWSFWPMSWSLTKWSYSQKTLKGQNWHLRSIIQCWVCIEALYQQGFLNFRSLDIRCSLLTMLLGVGTVTFYRNFLRCQLLMKQLVCSHFFSFWSQNYADFSLPVLTADCSHCWQQVCHGADGEDFVIL